MARTVDTLFDTTGASAGAVSFTGLNVAQYEMVTVWFVAAGAAAPTSCSVTLCDAAGTSLGAGSVTVAIAGKSPAVLGAVPATGVTNAVALGPVTPKINATGTGGAASTVRILVLGVRAEPS